MSLVDVVIAYTFTHLQLQQLYANISSENEVSLALFTKFGFETIGIKKQWNKVGNSYKDEWLVQLINPNS
jgi:diamine N-acetyltransferase